MRKIAFIAMCIFIFCISQLSAFASCNVVTLMYHNVTDDERRWDDYCVSPEQLEDDINYFTERGYITLTATELAEADMSSLDGKKVLLLTFDDGYVGWYTNVYPILERTGAKATMYIVGAYVNRYGYLSEEQIREMADGGLVEMGNHTNHIHQMPLEVLKTIYSTGVAGDIIADIRSNADYIKSITGKEVTSISWPYGYASQSLDTAVKTNLGYKISFSTNYGVTVYNGSTAGLFNRMNREHSKTSEEVYQRAASRFN